MKMIFTMLIMALTAGTAACSYKAAPDKVVHTGGPFKAVVEYTERCWEGCHIDSEISFRYGRSTLGSAFYGRELNVSAWRPFARQVLFFPAKNMMLARLDDSEDGWLLVAFVERDGEPHLRVLAGCLWDNGSTVSTRGMQSGARCTSQLTTLEYDGAAPYSSSAGFSYHGAYWIDYLRQEAHEVRIDLSQTHRPEQVVGLTADRAAVLLLFRDLEDENSYLLCAAGGPAHSAEDACVGFNRRGAPPATLANQDASAPFPSERLWLYNIDAMPVTRDWHAWLAGHFDLTTLDQNGRPRAVKK